MGTRQTGQQHHPQLGVLVGERPRRLLEQLDRAPVGDRRSPAGLLKPDRCGGEHPRVTDLAGDPHGVGERLDRAVGAPAPEAGGAELQLGLDIPARIIDPKLERGREAGLGLVVVERRQRGPPSQQGVLNRPPRPVHGRGGREVVGQLSGPVSAVPVSVLERLADSEVQLGAPQPGDPVIQRPADQLVREPVGQLPRRHLDDHAVGDRLLERRVELGVGDSRRRDHRQVELLSGDGGELDQRDRGGVELRQALADDLADALRTAELGHRTRQPGAVAGDRHRAAVDQGAPEFGHQERVAARQVVQDTTGVRQARAELTAARAAHELRDLGGAQRLEAHPRHSLRAPQVDQRRGQCLGDLGFGVAKRGHEQAPCLRRPPREVTQQQQRRRIGPVGVFDHQHQRRLARGRHQQVTDRAVEAVAFGIRIDARRRAQLSDPVGQIGQQPRQLAASGPDRLAQRL